MPIELTWNLFLTAILVPGSTLALKQYLDMKDRKRESKEAAMAKLLAEKEALEDKALSEWRDSYMKTLGSLSSTLCSVKTTVEGMKEVSHHKVDLDECRRLSEEKWDRINHHSHDEHGKVTIG